MTLNEAMQQAVTLHQTQRLAEAERAYAAILQQHPGFGDALNLYGVVLSQQGRHAEGIDRLKQAVNLQPKQPLWRHNLGKALQDAGHYGDAEREYRTVLSQVPEFREALFNLANLLKETERHEEAAAGYQRLLRMEPGHWRALNNLGNTQCKLKRLTEAEAALRSALKLRPDYADAHNNLGIVLADRKEYEAALDCYQRALTLRPGFAQASLNRGNALLDLDRRVEAITAFEQAIRLDPQLTEAHNNLGNARLALGDADAALIHYEHAVQLAPEDVSAHFNRALLYLLTGDFARGWGEYEWGLKGRLREPHRAFAQARWDGRRFDGRSLLIVAEQGVGDCLQFLRYLPQVVALGGSVIVEVQQGLSSLCARSFENVCFIERRNDGHIEVAFDVHCHLMSLPFLLGHRSEAEIAAQRPYLVPEPQRVERWAAQLAAFDGQRVGLVWAGNPEHKNDRRRSIPLPRLAPLQRIDGLQLFSLQKGRGSTELEAGIEGTEGIIDLSPQIENFEDTAAVVANLDRVITVDTSVAHLAGALGKPVWLLLPFAPDWRWQLHRRDTPWYADMQLWRQSTPGDWDEVVELLVSALDRVR